MSSRTVGHMGVAAAKPRPVPDDFSATYWAGAREHRLVIRRCQVCQTFQHPPAAFCRNCGSEALVPEELSGKGVVRSFVVLEETPVPGFQAETPFTVAAVELVEQPDLVLCANVIGPGRDNIEIGALTTMAWEELPDGTVLPQISLEGAN